MSTMSLSSDNNFSNKLNFLIGILNSLTTDNEFEDIKITNEHILKIFEDCIEKLKIAFTLPVLLRSLDKIEKSLPQHEFHQLLHLSNNFLNHEYDYQLQMGYDFSVDSSKFRSLLQIVEVIQSSNQLKTMLCTFAKNTPDKSDFLLRFRDFYEIVQLRLKTDPVVEILREKFFYVLYNENKFTQDNLAAKREKFTKRDLKRERRISPKQIRVKFQELTSIHEKRNMQALRKMMTQADQEMIKICASRESRRKQQEEQVDLAKTRYETLLKNNLLAEKQFRERRSRVVNQLQSWLKKYDNDIMNRLMRNEELKKALLQKQNDLVELTETYDKIEDEYTNMIGKADDIWQEKLTLFIENRAARIIQRAWRKYKELKALKSQQKKKNENRKKKSKQATKTKKLRNKK